MALLATCLEKQYLNLYLWNLRPCPLFLVSKLSVKKENSGFVLVNPLKVLRASVKSAH